MSKADQNEVALQEDVENLYINNNIVTLLYRMYLFVKMMICLIMYVM